MIKRKIVCFVVVLLMASLFLEIWVAHADSGWDYDYDSSSSWDSDSSWSSSSSWDSYSGGSYSGDLSDGGLFWVVFIIIIVLIIILSTRKSRTISASSITGSIGTERHGLSYDEIKAIDSSLDKEVLKEQAFRIYKEVQIAWMNFEEEVLRRHLTDEIYNMYASQLKTLKLKGQKNLMEDIILKDCLIQDIRIENGIETVEVFLAVSQYDYVVDKDKKVLRGTNRYKNYVEYEITLVRHVDHSKIDTCPNCGAPIDIVSGGVCPYCDSTIVNYNEEFVMSKKECVGQRVDHEN